MIADVKRVYEWPPILQLKFYKLANVFAMFWLNLQNIMVFLNVLY